jgi:hypothetical protein
MIDSEFITFVDHFQACFPDVWNRLLTAGGENFVPTWRRSLGSIELSDAISALDMIVDGKESLPNPHSLFPAVIRKVAGKLQARRLYRPPAPLEPARRGKHSMSAMLGAVLDCVKAGMSTAEALAQLNVQFPIDPEDQPRFRCMLCKDSGTVDVWHHTCVSAAIRGDDHIKRYRAIVVCTCEASLKIQAWPADLAGKPDSNLMPRYEHRHCCLWNHGDLEMLRAWATEYREMNPRFVQREAFA